ncbi:MULTISPECIES: hypothetical protein [Methylobacterium]|uniref:Exodeoxyribonuclease 7 large subunit n=1 Tax=Methylobacterium bullatum TaxID=570505 RepID=A0A679KJM1_9HYPH|nr:hypothetical protein [Methylobacterium sp. Leaf106]KQP48750.1 hypothetical protein ASF34_20620 [Methylobacterium sp. Leaf106]CAA2145562.1 Exodeoxyribonuclease 7 large subunit [Methylobacterium bullatum]
MTSYTVPQGANAVARLAEPAGITVRAEISRPHRHRDGWQFELSPLDRSRTGRLSAFMSDGFARQIEDASGMLFHAEDLIGQHQVMLTISMDALLGLTARIIGLDRGILVEAWNRQDAALEAALIAEGVWQAQRALPRPQRLRRVLLIEPHSGARTGAIGGILSRWADLGMIALIRWSVAFEEPGSLEVLQQTLEAAADQVEWGTADVLIVDRGPGYAFRALSDPALVRRLCQFPVPILTLQGGHPNLLDRLAWHAFETTEAMEAALTDILREEVRPAGRERFDAIVRELERIAVTAAMARSGALYD